MTACPVNESGKYIDGLWPNTPRPGTPERVRGTRTLESCSRTPGVKSTDSKEKPLYLTSKTIDLWPVKFAPRIRPQFVLWVKNEPPRTLGRKGGGR